MRTDKAQFKHDCKSCKFLGTTFSGDLKYDLYYCASTPTVLARYGDTFQFTSGLHFAISGSSLPLEAALLRAVAAGYCDIQGMPK